MSDWPRYCVPRRDDSVDEETLRALARWPSVPDVEGWLRLDRRGRWLLRGTEVTHPLSRAYIARNYQLDTCGRPFFQNGPQRVWVEVELAPWVYQQVDGVWQTHTGQPVQELRAVFLDEELRLFFVSEHGLGVVHERELADLLGSFTDRSGTCLESGTLETVLEDPLQELGFRWGHQIVMVQRGLPEKPAL